MHQGRPCKRGDHTGHRLEAHHPDHSKPLQIIWLCNSCHKYADARTQMTEAVIAAAHALRAQGLSLAYVAKRLGVSIRTLRRHVDGRARIHIDLVSEYSERTLGGQDGAADPTLGQ